MVADNFKSLKDLYQRIYPALKSKTEELKGKGYTFLTEQDLWEYLIKTKWHDEENLTLYDLVNDILYIEEAELLRFLSPVNRKEEIILEEEPENKSEDTIL